MDIIAQHAALDARKLEIKREMRARHVCARCNGKGEIVAYGWNQGGRCFQCEGTGVSAKGKGNAAALRKLHAALAEIEAEIAALYPVDAQAELPDLDTLDLSALVR